MNNTIRTSHAQANKKTTPELIGSPGLAGWALGVGLPESGTRQLQLPESHLERERTLLPCAGKNEHAKRPSVAVPSTQKKNKLMDSRL